LAEWVGWISGLVKFMGNFCREKLLA